MSTIRVDNFGPSAGGTTYSARGIAKAWVNFNGQGTIAARDSENVSSLTDILTGQYSVNLSNAFGAADYSISATATWSAGITTSTNTSINGDSPGKPTTTAFQTYSYVTANDVTYDPEFVFASAHGDLA